MIRRALVGVLVGSSLVAGLSAPALAQSPRTDTTPSSTLPVDPKVKGYIGLCDQAGHNVVGGSIYTRPFVWKAVATVPPPPAFQGAGQDAVLNIYQPRPDTLPGRWSGAGLTGASFYTNASAPAVQATYVDSTLAEFIANYPAKVNGLYVLRIYWGKRNYGLYSATYPAATIQVQGSQWHVVSGGTVNCSAATRATSLEQLTGVATKRDVTPRAPATNQITAPAGAPRRIVSTPGKATVNARGGHATEAGAGSTQTGAGSLASPAASSAASSSSSPTWVVWLLIALVALLAVALAATARARRSHPTPPLPNETKD